VPIDFDRLSVAEELTAAGYRAGEMTFFIWEGVTQYLTAASGSQIAFTYIDRGIIDGSNRSKTDQQIMSRVARRGMGWVFGLARAGVEKWLEQRGFRLLDHAGAADYRARYLAPLSRRATVYAGERMVLAEVA
jgi:O-methyltransferase involved in polyketide biosynthesis